MCKPKTMLQVGAILAAAFAVGWFAFPEVRSSFVLVAPFALVLVCPLAMLLGMYGMHHVHRGDVPRHSGCSTGVARQSTGTVTKVKS